MSPEEDLPPEVAPRAYLRQKVVEADRRHHGGPAVNIVLAFVILWGLYAVSTLTFTPAGRRQAHGRSPAAAGARARRPDRVRRRHARLLARARRAGRARPCQGPDGGIVTHTCAGTPSVGCRADDAGAARRATATGERLRYDVTPRFDRLPAAGAAAARRAGDPGTDARRPAVRPASRPTSARSRPPPTRATRCGRSRRRPSTRSSSSSTTRRRASRSPASSAPTRRRASPSSSTPSRRSTCSR